MNAPDFETNVIETPGFPGVSFKRTADGLLVALVGEHAFAVAPAQERGHFLVTGWRIRRPIAEWTRGDFYGHTGDPANENAFRAKVLENAVHLAQEGRLGSANPASSFRPGATARFIS